MVTPFRQSLLAGIMLVHAVIGCFFCCDHHHDHSHDDEVIQSALPQVEFIGALLQESGCPVWSHEHEAPDLHKCTCAFRHDPAPSIRDLMNVSPSLLADATVPDLVLHELTSTRPLARAPLLRPSAQKVRADLQVWLV